MSIQALTVADGGGDPRVESVAPPKAELGSVVVDGLALGVCGTDREIVSGDHDHGAAPDGESRLILGHESLGRVREAPSGAGFAPGDLVAGMVRHPDPVPCPACAAGEQDMCVNGLYTERGIKKAHGFGAEQWRADPEMLVKLDPGLADVGMLMEPTTVVAKGWDHIERIAARDSLPRRVLLVTGAGPIGLLGALLGAERGFEVHVLDLPESGPKPDRVRELGGTYHFGDVAELDLAPDVVIEATGVGAVVEAALAKLGAGGIACLTGIGMKGRETEVDWTALNKGLVHRNAVVFGSVNANRRHFAAAARALARADRDWLRSLITRREPLDRFREGLELRDSDVKVVLEL